MAVQFEAGGQKRLIHCHPICVYTNPTNFLVSYGINLFEEKQAIGEMKANTTHNILAHEISF